jgi:hypothetical protein
MGSVAKRIENGVVRALCARRDLQYDLGRRYLRRLKKSQAQLARRKAAQP